MIALAGVAPAFAQWEGYPTPGIPRTPDGSVNLNAPLPRTAAGKPDLSGIWQATRGAFNFAVGLKRGETVPFNAEGKKLFDERQANNSKDEPSARCLPSHVAMRNQLNTPMKIWRSISNGRSVPYNFATRNWEAVDETELTNNHSWNRH